MATFTRAALTAQARPLTLQKAATSRLHEEFQQFSAARGYDIFLSHSSLDADVILGLKVVLERHGLRVYVDWIDDPLLDRSKVTPETADALRKRMGACRALFYAYSPNSANSKWMPWELGYFDGHGGRVGIVPVTEFASDRFEGQEYLGLYPYVDEAGGLWVNRPSLRPVSLRNWLA